MENQKETCTLIFSAIINRSIEIRSCAVIDHEIFLSMKCMKCLGQDIHYCNIIERRDLPVPLLLGKADECDTACVARHKGLVG